MRTRFFSLAACALASVLLAAPTSGHSSAPPSTPPADDGTGGVPGIELVDGLGNGGQPEGLPREIVIEDVRYLFDRVVPLSRQELARIAQEQDTIAFAKTETGPFTAIYLSVPNRSEDELARYLPEGVGSTEPCPAEAGDFDRVDAGGSLYAFAGVEGDLTVDALQAVGDSDGAPIYADLASAQPFPELFIASGDELLRFVLVGADGRPTSLGESLAFNGAAFAFDSDVTDAVDPASLAKVGCSTAFPVYAAAGAPEGSVTELYVLAGTRWFRFIGDAAAPASTAAPTTVAPTTTTTTLPPTTITTLAPTTTTLPPTTTTTLAPTTTTLPPTTTTTLAPTTTTLPPTTTTTLAPTTTLPPTTTTTVAAAATLAPTTTTTVAPTTTTTEPASTTSTTSAAAPATSTTTASTTSTTTAPSTTAAPTTSTVPPAAESTSTTTTTEVIQPPAVVATLPPEAPAPAAANVQPTACTGDPGEPDARGLPQHLPARIQLGGVAYVFAGTDELDAVGTLNIIRCVGPFEAASSDQADPADVVYLRTSSPGPASELVYRFEAVLTFQIDFQITDQAQVLTAGDQTYRLGQTWQPAVYSSTTVVLFVEDPADPAPDTIYALDVSHSVVGDVIGEYRLPTETTQTSEELRALAEAAGLNPNLTINGQVYVLLEVYTPAGTTNNGFMTLFGAASGATPDVLLGRDQRERELFVFLLDDLGG